MPVIVAVIMTVKVGVIVAVIMTVKVGVIVTVLLAVIYNGCHM